MRDQSLHNIILIFTIFCFFGFPEAINYRISSDIQHVRYEKKLGSATAMLARKQDHTRNARSEFLVRVYTYLVRVYLCLVTSVHSLGANVLILSTNVLILSTNALILNPSIIAVQLKR